MSLIICDVGDSLTVRGTLKDENGTPLAGASVTARVISPVTGSETALGAATDEGAGVYSVTFDPSAPGSWPFRMESAAPAKAAAEGVIYVRETRFS